MAARSSSYEVLSEDAKCILRRYYDQGMKSIGSDKRDIINNAADEIGVSFQRVKVSI